MRFAVVLTQPITGEHDPRRMGASLLMGMMREEIHQQPEVLADLVSSEADRVQAIAADIRQQDVRFVVLAARGTSDNAARYGKYLFGSLLGLQAALATPSLFTLYGETPKLKDALVIGISQSGQSEDIVAVLEEGRRQGAPTLAITNDPGSPLASHAQHIIPLHAGVEQAVAATKTYSAQLSALAMLAAAWAGDGDRQAALKDLPDQVHQALTLETKVKAFVDTNKGAWPRFVLGRGYNYATAHEVALKLKEICNLTVEAYSPADFLHGPIALLAEKVQAVILAHSGATLDSLIAFSARLKEQGASLLVVSDADRALELADVPMRLTPSTPEWLSPVTMVVPGQLLAFHLALHLGLDPDRPAGLSKVTITR